jgi:hypothetical protein
MNTRPKPSLSHEQQRLRRLREIAPIYEVVEHGDGNESGASLLALVERNFPFSAIAKLTYVQIGSIWDRARGDARREDILKALLLYLAASHTAYLDSTRARRERSRANAVPLRTRSDMRRDVSALIKQGMTRHAAFEQVGAKYGWHWRTVQNHYPRLTKRGRPTKK